MGSSASSTEAPAASEAPPITGCVSPLCNQPAVRAQPGTMRPMCQRHLLAACRESSPGDAAERERRAQRASHEGDGSISAATTAASSAIQLDCLVQWVASCSDATGYLGDASGRVVPAELAGDRGVALPQPALFAALLSKSVHHLVVASLDGTSRLRCHSCGIDFQRRICGLHCHKQQLFIAQTEAVTVTDLSGRIIFRIPSYALGTRKEIFGIGGNADTLLVSGGDTVAAFSKATGVQQTLIDLAQLPSCLDADQLVAITGTKNSVLVIGKSRRQVHALNTDNRQLVATYPNRTTGFDQFERLWCAVADTRGRIFASDGDSHTVYAMAPDGSVLRTFGGDCSDDDSLLCPRGLAIAQSADGSREHLVVADWGHKRLVVFDL